MTPSDRTDATPTTLAGPCPADAITSSYGVSVGRRDGRPPEHRAGYRDGERGGFGWNTDELLRAIPYVAVSVDRPRGAAVATGSGNDDRDSVSTGRGSVRRTDVMDGDARSTSNRLFVSQLLLRVPPEARSAWAAALAPPGGKGRGEW